MKFHSQWAASVLFVIALGMSSLAIEVQAATFTWNCTNDTWGNTACWNPNGAPTSSDAVYVPTVSSANTFLTIDGAAGTSYANSLTIDASAGTTVTLQQTAGGLSTGQQYVSGGNEYVGYSGTGTSSFIQSGGTNTLGFGGNLFVGYNTGSNGTYNLSNTGSLSGNYSSGFYEYVGYSGSGAFNQSGGTNTATFLFVGSNNGSNGAYNLNAGSLGAREGYVGYAGTGTFTQSGGTNAMSDLYLGSMSGGNGTYNLNAGNLTVGFNEYVGGSGMGAFNQSGGTNTTSFLYVVNSGIYDLNAGSLKANYWEYVGYSGNATFTQNGGTNTVTGAANGLTLGFNSGSNGTYNQNAGTNMMSYLYLGYNSGSNGTYNLNNTGSLSAGYEYVGYAGTGIFNQSGGTNTLSGDLHLGVGSYIGSSGTYNLNAGSLSVGGNIVGIGTSTFNIGNGTLTVGGGNGSINVGNFVLDSIAGSNVNYTLTSTGLYQGVNKVAGTLTTGNLVIGKDGTGTFTQTSGANMTTGTVTLAANTGSSGTYNLIGGALHAANITVNSGGSFNFTGGTLSVGQFTGNLANLGGTLAPGNSPGTTNITGNYSQTNAGTFAVEIGGTAPGEFDVLHVSGTATLDGTLSVSLFDLGSGLFTPHQGDSFDILTADILNGQFSSLSLAALGNGLSWNISYLTDAIGTTDVVRLTAVPLPAAFWLFGSGLLGLIGTATKRTRGKVS